MSFRNISKRSYRVLRTRPKRPTDEHLWQNIYPPQVGKKVKVFQQFAVANWIPIVVGIVAVIGGAVGGFYLGQKYAVVDVGKKFAEGAIDLLPKGIQAQARKFM